MDRTRIPGSKAKDQMMMADNNRVAIIIPTYNGGKFVVPCIESLLKDKSEKQIIIVDNASNDNTIGLLDQYGSEVKIIQNAVNKGFGHAVNQGLIYGLENQFDYFFILNQDIVLIQNALETLMSSFMALEWGGLLSPIHNSDFNGEKDKLFERYLSEAFEEDEKLALVNFVNAAAWFLDRKTLLKIGLFDPLFFHTGEDQDYCNRLRYHKLKVGIIKNAKIVHKRQGRLSYDAQSIASFRHSVSADLIKYAKNINRSLILSLGKSSVYFFRKGIDNLVKCRLNQVALLGIEFLLFLIKIPSIIHHRIQCKREKAFINEWKEING